jgi:1-acyl-sn-glycerol-3-phosphate acyltransferase
MIGNAFQWLRSLLFNAQMYASMPLFAIVYFPYALVSREGAYKAIHAYTSWVLWTASWMVGLKTETRGTPPDSEVIIAAKHQSFLDILIIANATPRPRFIMKSILRFAPILGWFALRIGCVPVDRGKKTKAIEQMRQGVANNPAGPGQLIIYPQGTRVAPGAERPYKVGPAILYTQLNQPCVPAATNVGMFWPRRGVTRKPGLGVVEFLDPISPGLDQKAFMIKLEQVVETNSDRLMREAGLALPERTET